MFNIVANAIQPAQNPIWLIMVKIASNPEGTPPAGEKEGAEQLAASHDYNFGDDSPDIAWQDLELVQDAP
jgi:hypothetical protein